jgi:hypothetical protein
MSPPRAASHPQSPHALAQFDTEDAELNSSVDRTTKESAEAGTSGHLVRMIDFFFALVLGQGLLRYSAVVVSPFHSNVAVVLALVTIYYTVIRSFIAWHSAIEHRRYRIETPEVRTLELWRVYIDALIVGTYAYLLLTAEPLIHNSGANLQRLLWGFPLLFLLYLAWGQLRRAAWGLDDFDLGFLVIFGLVYAVVALIYTLAPWDLLANEKSLINVIFLGGSFGLMMLYRRINFWQGFSNRPSLRLGRLKTLGPDAEAHG